MDDLSQYRELYIQTSKEYIQKLNDSLLKLETDTTDKGAIEEIFRSAHSLKSQSATMGYLNTGYLCHVIEDVFFEIKNNRLVLSPELADHVFKALDGLTSSLQRIERENQEIDLSSSAEVLKDFSGVAPSGKPDPQPRRPVVTLEMPQVPSTSITTIAVKSEDLDEILGLLENLLVEQLKLVQGSTTTIKQSIVTDYANTAGKILAALQYHIMKIRAVPVSLVLNHFPRAVRDLARAENKHIQLVITGASLELDRTIVERLDEPLTHLLRNAVSHGIQETGTITLSATRQNDYAQVSVADNGRGIDWQQIAQKANLGHDRANTTTLKEALFSGITTSRQVTQISGRGIGLTVTKKLVDDFGGSIDVDSTPGHGTTFTIKLPLTLAITTALIVSVDHTPYAIPVIGIKRIVKVPPTSIKHVADVETCISGDEEMPLVRLAAKLGIPTATPPSVTDTGEDLVVVVVGASDKTTGLVVGAIHETTDIIIKPVPSDLKNVAGFSGVTILGDGQTALIINPQEFI